VKPLLCSLLLLFAFSLSAQAPTAVPIPNEPHHHLVLENDYVRVFRVSVPAHQATLLHQHDGPYVYVALGPANVINAIQDKPEVHLVMADGQVGYSRGGFAHIARNESDTPFDNVTIELLRPQGEPKNLCEQVLPGAANGPCQKVSADSEKGYSIVPQIETGELKLDLVRLDPNATKIAITPHTGTLFVVLNESELQFNSEGSQIKRLRGGEVIWLEASSHQSLANSRANFSSYLQLSFKNSGAGSKP